jgi:hypothetical protein
MGSCDHGTDRSKKAFPAASTDSMEPGPQKWASGTRAARSLWKRECKLPIRVPPLKAMSPEIKKNVAWVYVVLAASVSCIVLTYLMGRFLSVWIFTPVLLLPVAGALVCCVLLFASWIRSLFTGRHPLGKGVLFLLGIFFTFGGWAIIGYFRLEHRGFDDFARAMLTPGEWRELARASQEQMKLADGSREHEVPSHVGAIVDPKSGRPVPHGKLPEDTRLWVTTDRVTFIWGSALTTHRTIVVYNHPPEKLPEGAPRPSFIADDIATWFLPH